MSDRTVTLVLVPVEIPTGISGSYAAKYVVNSYVSQIRVTYVSKLIRTLVSVYL